MTAIRKRLRQGELTQKGKARGRARAFKRQTPGQEGTPVSYLTTFSYSDIEHRHGKKPRVHRHTGDLMVPSSVKRIPNPRASRVRRGSQRPPIWLSKRGIADFLGFKKRRGAK